MTHKPSKNRLALPTWLRILLAYSVMLGGIITLILLPTARVKSWLVGLWLIIVVIPLFPAMQAILLKKKPASWFMFFKTYTAELVSLSLQLVFLLTNAPFIAILVGGVLACVLLASAVIAWVIVGLQQLGLDIGSKMSSADIATFFWITNGLIIAVAIFYTVTRLVKKYGDRYFAFWGRQFVKVRAFFDYDVSGPG